MPSLDIAFSEAAFITLFESLRDNTTIRTSGSTGGTFNASYDAVIRFRGGRVDLKDSPDEIKLNELDILYDRLNLGLAVDIPEVCVGGGCILRIGRRCRIRAPRICLFTSNPDINIPLNLSGFIRSEISGAFDLGISYFDNPAGAGMNVYDAHNNNVSDTWRLNLIPRWLDFDFIDFADTIGDLLDSIVDNFINSIFGGLPGFARDILGWLLHGINDIVRGILDIGDDISEWLSDLLGVSIGLFDYILQKVAEKFSAQEPIYEIENPYPILENPLVLLPINSISKDITDTEIRLSINI